MIVVVIFPATNANRWAEARRIKMIRHIKVCLQESATDIEVETLIEWLQGVRCTGAVYEVREIRPTKHAPDVVESAASTSILQASALSASEAESKPATTQVM